MDVEALLTWYERVRRPLPWRETRDPYALLVSEVMLQQTQALRVVPYYERWLARFPDAAALADAPVRDVLVAWSGLGYNRRALALQRAAAVVARHGWPDDLTELPGVGPYTAAAVGSFAWDRQVAAVDTNVRRVLSRRDGVDYAPVRLRAGDELLPAGRAAVQPGDDGARRDGLPPARAALRRVPRRRRLRRPARTAPPAPQPRFEDTDRWARGRVLAALLSGEAPPVHGARRERAVAGLERDGLVVRGPDGRLGCPEPASTFAPGPILSGRGSRRDPASGLP